ncbi:MULTISPECIES: hypothetical protein [unclassified Streptomyces]|uniref:Uncharacterized protein n=1 Tax=Streptomyces sp. NBC_00119 TaxID=2975659 RepID=A0AAU1UL50_9ACTN|nr:MULTISPECIES: hypothetical protein [unclassified Streptomyces]MCX4649701.1 hypothetical protein [Streptomyces sp. NBC_01446]MCX5321090.1 hypothetical protein [Streptomyces sp. NBC_00120]
MAQRPEELRARVEENLVVGLEQLSMVNLRRMDVGFTPPMPDDQLSSLRWSRCATRARSARSG